MTIRTPLIILLLHINTSMHSQSETGLVGDYKFDAGKFQNEVTKKDIKASNVMLVDDRFGNPKSAVYFQGTEGSYLNLGTSKEIRPNAGSFSLWIKIERAALAGKGFLANPIIITKNSENGDFFEAFVLSYNYDEERICVSTSLSEEKQVHIRGSRKLPLGEWHHYAFSYDDNFLRLYIDGKLEGEVPKNFRSKFLDSDSVLIGATANKKNDRFLLGYVDDIRIYNRILSDAEVLELSQLPDPNRFHRVLKWAYVILGILVLTSLIVWLMVRRSKKKIKQQEEKNKMIARMNELETRAIRMHMNPHFIFNSLNSLQRYILEADVEKAQNYLSRFSILLRKILESSNSETISLDQEIEILTTYIEIEKERFENSFSFEIQSTIEEPETIQLPFMLVQPLVENAIWHGLLPKSGDKKLSIRFRQKNTTTIICQIEDNGIGISTEQSVNSNKKKSQGISFLKQRLDIIQKVSGGDCGIEIESLYDANQTCIGTRVTLIIPIVKL